jgi:hypothetical protein
VALPLCEDFSGGTDGAAVTTSNTSFEVVNPGAIFVADPTSPHGLAVVKETSGGLNVELDSEDLVGPVPPAPDHDVTISAKIKVSGTWTGAVDALELLSLQARENTVDLDASYSAWIEYLPDTEQFQIGVRDDAYLPNPNVYETFDAPLDTWLQLTITRHLDDTISAWVYDENQVYGRIIRQISHTDYVFWSLYVSTWNRDGVTTYIGDVGADCPELLLAHPGSAPCGDKVIKYEVTSQLAGVPYAVAPLGPDDEVHHERFKIDDTSRTVSIMTSLASEITQDFYVFPQAVFQTWNGTAFTTVSVQNMGSSVHLVGDGEWETITRLLAAPSNATHWLPRFAIAANSGATTPPDIGTILYLDCVYVSESGLDLAAEPYLDGDVIATLRGDGAWEGDPHNSTSIFAVEEVPEDPDTPPDNDDDDGGGTDVPDDPGEDTPNDPTPEPPAEEPELTPGQTAALVLSGIEPSGLCMDADVQLGDHFFNRVDEFGVLWIVSDIEGWWTLPDPDIPDFPKGYDDGSYESRGRYQARIFTLTGSFFPPGRAAVRPARDRLVRAANLCHYGAWFATHESDITKASKVWLSGRPEISTINVNGRTDFSIGLKAPDPIKYGIPDNDLTKYETRTMVSQSSESDFGWTYPRTYPRTYGGGTSTATQVIASNIGNVRVYPIITINGPTLGPIQIHKTGPDNSTQMMRVAQGTYDNADVLVIDCQNRTVSLNGVPNQRFYLDTFTDWIYLDPGANRMYFAEETGPGAASITVSWRSGWIG